MKKQLAMFCVLVLSMSLLSGCRITSPNDKEFQRDWVDSMTDSIEEAAEEWAQDWEDSMDEAARAWSTQDENGVEKDHYWKVLDEKDNEAGTVTDPEQVKTTDPGDPAYSYIYCQQETLKVGQKEEDRKYEELVRFTVSASEDVVTLVILEDLPSLLHVDLGRRRRRPCGTRPGFWDNAQGRAGQARPSYVCQALDKPGNLG